MTPSAFEVICEIEPATTPDLKRVRHQIGVLSPIASAFLIPDNHIGRATVSSVAVAHEVEAMGGRSIACLNARDRNLLGFRRDLLTAAAYGVDQFLFVYGDEPRAGARTSELTVRTMLGEGRTYAAGLGAGRAHAFRRRHRARDAAELEAGGRLPLRADRLLPRRPPGLAGAGGRHVPVYAGVIVVASVAMARSLRRDPRASPCRRRSSTGSRRDRNAGVDAACDSWRASATRAPSTACT